MNQRHATAPLVILILLTYLLCMGMIFGVATRMRDLQRRVGQLEQQR